MENWTEHILNLMDSGLEGTSQRKLKFFRLSELKRNIIRIGQNSGQCARCEDFKAEVEAVINHINEAVNVPGPERRELDRLIFRLSHHFMKAHGLFPPHHYRYLYSVTGTILGLISGLLLMKFFPSMNWYIVVPAILAGLISGIVPGILKDRKMNELGKLM
jgi:hypothetical protein